MTRQPSLSDSDLRDESPVRRGLAALLLRGGRLTKLFNRVASCAPALGAISILALTVAPAFSQSFLNTRANCKQNNNTFTCTAAIQGLPISYGDRNRLRVPKGGRYGSRLTVWFEDGGRSGSTWRDRFTANDTLAFFGEGQGFDIRDEHSERDLRFRSQGNNSGRYSSAMWIDSDRGDSLIMNWSRNHNVSGVTIGLLADAQGELRVGNNGTFWARSPNAGEAINARSHWNKVFVKVRKAGGNGKGILADADGDGTNGGVTVEALDEAYGVKFHGVHAESRGSHDIVVKGGNFRAGGGSLNNPRRRSGRDTNQAAVYARSHGTGDIFVSGSRIVSVHRGIHAKGRGSLTVDFTGNIDSQGRVIEFVTTDNNTDAYLKLNADRVKVTHNDAQPAILLKSEKRNLKLVSTARTDIEGARQKGVEATAKGNIDIDIKGHVRSQRTGVYANSTSGGAVTVTVATVTVSGPNNADSAAVQIKNQGTGATTFTATGKLKATGRSDGIHIPGHSNNTTMTVNIGEVEAHRWAVRVDHKGSKNVTITANSQRNSGKISSTGNGANDGHNAVIFVNHDTNATSHAILSLKAVENAAGKGAAIRIDQRAKGDISLRATSVTRRGSGGANALEVIRPVSSTGSIGIVVSGAVDATAGGGSGDAISVVDPDGVSDSNGRLDIKVGGATGGWMGMRLIHRRGGNVTITSTGAVVSKNTATSGGGATDPALFLQNHHTGTAPIFISVATVTASAKNAAAIKVDQRGSGNITIRGSGPITRRGNGGEAAVLVQRATGSRGNVDMRFSDTIDATAGGGAGDAIKLEDPSGTSDSTGTLFISVATATGGWIGMRLRHRRGGDVTINATGAVTSKNTDANSKDPAILLDNYGADSDIDMSLSAAVTGSAGKAPAIKVVQHGAGDIDIDASGPISRRGTGNAHAVFVERRGAGNVSLNFTGAINGNAGGGGGDAINMESGVAGAEGNLFISVATATGAWAGVRVKHKRGGDVTINVTGNVTSKGGGDAAISLINDDHDSAININVGTQSSVGPTVHAQGTQDADAIRVLQEHNGNVTIEAHSRTTVRPKITTSGRHGVYVKNQGTGNVTITASEDVQIGNSTVTRDATIEGASRGAGVKVEAQSSSGPVAVTVATVTSSGHGLNIVNQGSGATTITATNTISASRDGIRVDRNANSNAGANLRIRAGSVSGGWMGMRITHRGAGTLSINATGPVISTQTDPQSGDSAISVNNHGGGDANITLATVTASAGRSNALYVAQHDSGNVHVRVARAVTRTGAGAGNAVKVRHNSSGNRATLTISGAVTSTDGGVYLKNDAAAANLNLSVATVTAAGTHSSGGSDAIRVIQEHGGTVEVGASGAVSTSGRHGVFVTQQGSGNVSVNLAGNVTGGSDAADSAIKVEAGAGTRVALTLSSAVGGVDRNAIVETGGSATVDVTSGGEVKGHVDLGAGDDTLRLVQASAMQAGDWAGGAGDDELVFDRSNGALDSAAGWEEIEIGAGSNIHLHTTGTNTLTTDTLTVTGTLTIGTGANDRETDATLRLAGDLAGGGTVAINANFVDPINANFDGGGHDTLEVHGNITGDASLAVSGKTQLGAGKFHFDRPLRFNRVVRVTGRGELNTSSVDFGAVAYRLQADPADAEAGWFDLVRYYTNWCRPVSGTPGAFLCSGSTLIGGPQSLSASGDVTLAVTLASETGVHAKGTAFSLEQTTGTGGIILSQSAFGNSISGTVDGVVAAVNRGAVSINLTGLADGQSGYGVKVTGTSDGAGISITAADVSGVRAGVKVVSSGGEGGIRIKTTGAVEATGSGQNGEAGIVARGTGTTGAMTIDVATVTGSLTGILATQRSANPLSIIATQNVTGKGGSIHSAIDARTSSGGDLRIDVASVTALGALTTGIKAVSAGSGDLTITATGLVSSEQGVGVDARIQGSGDLRVAAATVTGSSFGIKAEGTSAGGQTGAISIMATGSVSGSTAGVSASAQSGDDMTISVATVSGGTGIKAVQENAAGASGGVDVTATGSVTGSAAGGFGIEAEVERGAGAVSVAAGSASGGAAGISAAAGGTGAVTVRATGLVMATTTSGIGIDVSASGGAVSVSAAAVTGSVIGAGIRIKARGAGEVSVSTSGAVAGGARSHGIHVDHDGSGPTRIAVSNSVTGGQNWSAIRTDDLAGSRVTLALASGASVGTGTRNAIFGSAGNTEVTVDRGGAIFGSVTLGAGNDGLTFAGGSFESVTGMDGGTGVDTLTFSNGASGTLHADVMSGGLKGWENVFVTDGASISSVKLAGDSDNLTFDGADISGIGTLTADGGNSDNTLSFKNLSGTLADATLTGWEQVSIGAGATIKFGNGQHAFAKDVSVAANGILDVGDDTDASDVLTVSGDFEGDGVVALNANFLPNAGAADKLKITGNVSGSTIVRLRAVPGELVGNQTDEDRPETISGVIEVTGNVTASAFFAAGDIVFGNVGYVLEPDGQNAKIFKLQRYYTNNCAQVGPVGSGEYTCSGSGPIGDSQSLTAQDRNLVVTLHAETPTITLGANGGTSFELGQRGTGGISFTQSANGKWIRGSESGIDADNGGDGAISINVNAAVTAAGGDGVKANNTGAAGGEISITTGPVSGSDSGIKVAQSGSAAVKVSASGAVTGTSEEGIYALAKDSGGPISVTAAAVSGGKFGIWVASSGTRVGAISVKATGAVTGSGTGTGTAGIHAVGSARTTDVTIDAVAVSGGSGISAKNSGTGKLDINAAGAVSGTGTAGRGIRGEISSASGAGLTITAANAVSGSAYGIEARNSGSGAVSVAVSGAVTASGGKGIFVNAGSTAGTVTITAATVTGTSRGIEAFGPKAVSIDASGPVSAGSSLARGIYGTSTGGPVTVTAAQVTGAGYGIVARSTGAGVTIRATGTVTGTAKKGILADTSVAASYVSKAIAITVARVVGNEAGIEARQRSAGDLTISAAGAVYGAAGTGVDAVAESRAGALTVSVADKVTGSSYGIKAVSSGSGAVNVQVGGAVTASAGVGIHGSAGSGAGTLTITAAAVTGATIGIKAIGSGSGGISVKATGAVSGTSTAGVQAIGAAAGGAMKIDVAAATGSIGIEARQASANRLEIKATGSVSGTGATSAGIHAVATSDAAISIDAATVTGGGSGIRTDSNGAGTVSIRATGAVVGSSLQGIRATASSGAAITITAADVSGATQGVYAKTQGTISIATSGTVTGNSNNGIYAYQTGTGSTRVTVFGGVSTPSSNANHAAIKTTGTNSANEYRPVAIALERGALVSGTTAILDALLGNATVTVKPGAAVNGKIDLGPGNDVLHFAGGTFSGVGEMQGGAGNDTLRFSGGSGELHSTVQVQGLKGWESVIVEKGAALSGTIRLANDSNNLTLDGVDISSIGTLTADGSNTGNTLSFKGREVSGSLAAKTVTGWESISIGAGANIKFADGSVSRAFNLSLAAGGTLDLGSDSDTSDALLLTGNFAGGGTITLNANFTGNGTSDQLFLLGASNQVTGITSIEVNPVGQLGANETDADRPQRIAGVITVAGTVQAGAFTSVSVGFDEVGYRLEVNPNDSKVFDLVQFPTNDCKTGAVASEGSVSYLPVVCEGSQIGSTQSLGASGNTELRVTLNARTAVNAGATAFVLEQSGGNRGLSFTQSATGKQITAGQTAIDATNSGGGAISINVNGPVTGIRGDGIRAQNDASGFGIMITAASVVAGSFGIAVFSSGAGAASVKASGAVSGGRAGVKASVGGTLTLDLASVTGGVGIDASSSGGNVTISAGDVTGTNGGIKVSATGTNNVMIIPSGDVAGGSGDGIYVGHDGNGSTTITVSKAVTGGTASAVAAIRTARTAGNLDIRLHSGASVGVGARNAITGGAGNSTVTVNTGATVAGRISLGGGNDHLEFRGGSFGAVTEMDGGGGSNDVLVFSNDATGRLSTTLATNGLKGWESVEVKNRAALSGTIRLAASSDNLTFDRTSIANIGTLAASGNNSNNRLAFRNNVSGSLNAENVTGWEEINVGRRSRINFGSGARTLTVGTLKVDPGGTLDVGDDSDTGDTLTVSGNFEGGGVIALDANFAPNSRGSDKLVITGSVSGATTVNISSLGAPNIPGSIADTDHIYDVITVQGVMSAGANFTGYSLFGAHGYRLRPQADSGGKVFYLQAYTTNKCKSEGTPGAFRCEGTNQIGAASSYSSSGTHMVKVTLNSETPVDTDGTAFTLTQTSTSGITFTQSASGQSAIGEESFIVASNSGGGAISINLTGTVTGLTGDGIRAANDTSGAGITITAASVQGANSGIEAEERGRGAVKIVATGTVTGVAEEGVYAKTADSGGAITVTAASVSGGKVGIKVSASGRAAVSVKATGAVTGTATAGIHLVGGARATSAVIDAAAVTGKSGIDARHGGTGKLDVKATGAVMGTGTGGVGIYGLVSSGSRGALTITATSDVTGSATGIRAVGSGSGAVSVSAAGDVTGTGTGGIGVDAAANASAGALTINVATVTGSVAGIKAVGRNRNGVNVSASGPVAATGAASGAGIDALATSGGNLTITAAAVTGSAIGIKAVSSGAGAVRVKATGAVTGTGTAGIQASGGGSAAGLMVDAARVTGSAGIDAQHAGSGELKIKASDLVTGSTGTGISGLASGNARLSITAAAVTGGTTGIKAVGRGAGAVAVKATGAVMGTGAGGVGIDAMASGGNIAVSAATVTGTAAGIKAVVTGNGGVSISATGAVTGAGAGAAGIDAMASGGNVTVSAAAVTGLVTGIKAVAARNGTVSISASGAVAGSNGDGILVDHNGSGATTITVTAAVTGGSGSRFAAITTDAASGGSVTIMLNRGASVGSSGRNAIKGGAGNSAVTANYGATVTGTVALGEGSDTLILNRGATVSGAIDMGAGNDSLTFAGGAFASVTEIKGGEGTDTLTFSGGSGPLNSTVQTQGLKGWESIVVRSGATITGGIKLAGDSDSLTLDGVNIANIGELNGGGGADSTLALNNVSGALDSLNVVGWGKVDIGGNSSLSLYNSLSVGTLSVAEGATLDATGATNGRANDVLTLNGDFSGGGFITLNVDFLSGNNNSADHVVITGNVTGTTTIKLERLGSGPILSSLSADKDLPVIKVQGVASASAFVLDALVGTGETFTYRLVKGPGGDNTFSLKRISANKCRETVTGSGDFVCSGANQIGIEQSLGATDGTPLRVTLNSETLVQTGGAAFTLTQSGGAGGIEFTQSANGKAVTGVTSGIRATNKDGGAISISVNGAVTGGSEYGIRAENDASGAGIAITVATVTGGSAAIMASASGSGAVSVNATGAVNGTSGKGIDARTGNGRLMVAAATATGRDAGIKAAASGSGSVSISASGEVKGTGANGSGIDASASGGNVTVSAATVTGGATGIRVRASGSGSVSISASGTVKGTASDGIFVDHDGAGATTITVTTAVTGGTGNNFAAIRTDAQSNSTVTIDLNSGASVGATTGTSNAIMGGGGSAAVTVNTGAAVNGKIRLGGGADTLTFAGGTFSNVAEMDGGAGNDTLTFSGGSGSLHGTVQSEGLKGWETVVVGSGADLSGAIKLDGTSRKLKLDGVELDDLGALTGGGVGTTLELSAVSGEIKSAVTGWGTVAVESGSSISFGTRSVTANALTVAANATLKVSGSTVLTANTTVAAGGTINLAGDNSVNDTLTVSGNLSGGGTIVLNAQFSPSSASSDQLVIKGTVSGTPTVSFKKTGDVDPANAPLKINNVITVESNGASVSGSAFKIGGDFDFGPITYVLKSESRASANAPYVFYLERIYSNECERVEGALGEYFCSGEFLIGETQNLPANGSGALGSSALVVSLASQTPVNVSSGAAFRLRHTGRAGIAFQQQAGGKEIKAAGDGFNAVNAGGGSVAIVATGSITAGNDGVSVSNDSRGFGVRVAVATVDAGNDGVSVSNSGAGGVEVSATGAITAKGDGVSATGGANGLGVYVSVATVTAEAGHGVSVDSDGAGSVSVRAESAKGGDAGIRVRMGSRGTNMVIAAGSVEGDSAGVSVEHRGRGLARITTSGRVIGTGDGIDARVGRNGSLAIYASGAVTGTRGDGIRARSDAAAPISISVSSKVTGGKFSGKAAISTDSDGGKTTILLESGASVGATGRGTAIIDGGSEATVTLQSGASIIGDVKLGGGADELILAGGDFTRITAIDGGAGEDTLRITAGSGRLSALSDGSGAKNIERIVVSAAADLGGDFRVGAQTRELVFVDSDDFVDEKQFDDDSKLVGDGEARLAFRNVTGDLDLSRLSNWGTLEIGAGSSMKIDGATLEKDAAGGIVLLGAMQFGSSSRTDDTFTVEGDFSGEGGFVNVDANLATGQSDRIVIEGDVSGTTHIEFSDHASSSDQPKNGDLEVVTVGGKAEAGAFSLKGGSVPAGAFSYDLQFVSEGNKFVLRPGERVSDAGAALRTAPAALADGFAKATTLAQRTAARAPTAVIGARIGSAATYSERRAELAAQGAADLSALPGRSVWLRIYGDKREYGADAVSGETEISSTGLQFGLDLLSMEFDSGKWIAGLSAQYGTVKAETSGSGGIGTQDSSGYGLGATFSWFAYSGFYADAQAQFGTVDSDYASSSMSAIKSGVSAGVSLTSLEVGWRIAAGETTVIVPQAQISAGSVKSDGFTADSLRVESATATTVDGRLGLAAEFPIPNGAVRVSSSLSRTLSEPDGTVINGKTVEQDLPNGWMEFGVGASQDLSEDAVLFLDGTWRTGVGGADSTGTSISGGLKISW